MISYFTEREKVTVHPTSPGSCRLGKEDLVGSFGRLVEQRFEDFQSLAPAQLCRFDDAGEDGYVLRSRCAACPGTDFAEDHEESRCPVPGVVVGRRSSETHESEGEGFAVFRRAGEKPLAQGPGGKVRADRVARASRGRTWAGWPMRLFGNLGV